jgi:bifunctional DNA-binding transcriptional regulator/antitoxin component of YhaV-PrlF toxin-antitoxin module
MKWIIFNTVVVTILAGLLTGCKPKATESPNQVTAVPQFSAKKGLLLPNETRRSLGLKIVDVSEREVSGTLVLQLRVYRADGTAVLASGAVTTEQAKLLRAGQQLEARTSEGKAVAAKVRSVNDELQKATGSVELLIEISNTPGGVAVGDFLQAIAKVDSGTSAATIPRTALLGCSEGHFVYTVSGEHLVRTAVKVGASNDEWVEITDGLYAGDQVVLQPVMSLWLTELAAVKGGQACCVEPPKGK